MIQIRSEDALKWIVPCSTQCVLKMPCGLALCILILGFIQVLGCGPRLPASEASSSENGPSTWGALYAIALMDTLKSEVLGGDLSDIAVRESVAMTRLEPVLRQLIPSSGSVLFPGKGRLPLGLFGRDELCWSPLLGLEWSSPTEQARVTVTTRALMQEWRARVVKDPDFSGLDAVAMRDFLSSNVVWDVGCCSEAAFVSYCGVPVSDTTGGLTVAMLGTRSQDFGPCLPDAVFLAAVRGDRIILIQQSIEIWKESSTLCDGIVTQRMLNSADGGAEAMSAYIDCMRDYLQRDSRFKLVRKRVDRLVASMVSEGAD